MKCKLLFTDALLTATNVTHNSLKWVLDYLGKYYYYDYRGITFRRGARQRPMIPAQYRAKEGGACLLRRGKRRERRCTNMTMRY